MDLGDIHDSLIYSQWRKILINMYKCTREMAIERSKVQIAKKWGKILLSKACV
jgi:hypothetical protein